MNPEDIKVKGTSHKDKYHMVLGMWGTWCLILKQKVEGWLPGAGEGRAKWMFSRHRGSGLQDEKAFWRWQHCQEAM